MRVANMMFGREGGGVEQALIDHSRALLFQGHEVITVTLPDAWANQKLPQEVTPYFLSNLGEWDPIAAFRLRRLLQDTKPDVVIAHSNRALSLALKAVKGRIPIIAVAHNYRIRRCTKADAVFAITQDVAKEITQLGMDRENIFCIPNMVEVQPFVADRPSHNPPVIGALGRFVPKKGFDTYLRALKILQDQQVPFKAVLGGSGEEEANLRELAGELGLEEVLDFIGWVDDLKAFYDGIDLFCLPSLHEPFGIVLIEAFSHGVPVVSTDTEGPVEIITPEVNALLVPKGDPDAMADVLKRLLSEDDLRHRLAVHAHETVCTHYTHEKVGVKMSKAMDEVVRRFRIL